MLFPESQKVIEYFPDMAEAVQSNEIPANHPLFKIIQIWSPIHKRPVTGRLNRFVVIDRICQSGE